MLIGISSLSHREYCAFFYARLARSKQTTQSKQVQSEVQELHFYSYPRTCLDSLLLLLLIWHCHNLTELSCPLHHVRWPACRRSGKEGATAETAGAHAALLSMWEGGKPDYAWRGWPGWRWGCPVFCSKLTSCRLSRAGNGISKTNAEESQGVGSDLRILWACLCAHFFLVPTSGQNPHVETGYSRMEAGWKPVQGLPQHHFGILWCPSFCARRFHRACWQQRLFTRGWGGRCATCEASNPSVQASDSRWFSGATADGGRVWGILLTGQRGLDVWPSHSTCWTAFRGPCGRSDEQEDFGRWPSSGVGCHWVWWKIDLIEQSKVTLLEDVFWTQRNNGEGQCRRLAAKRRCHAARRKANDAGVLCKVHDHGLRCQREAAWELSHARDFGVVPAVSFGPFSFDVSGTKPANHLWKAADSQTWSSKQVAAKRFRDVQSRFRVHFAGHHGHFLTFSIIFPFLFQIPLQQTTTACLWISYPQCREWNFSAPLDLIGFCFATGLPQQVIVFWKCAFRAWGCLS